MLSRPRALKPGTRPEAVALVVNRQCKEFFMNRTFSIIALQSAVAAAIISVAPLASADPSQERPPVAASTGSTLSRAEVRQAAIEARDARLRSMTRDETLLDPTSAPFVSTASRAQVHAEAVEATRLGLTSSYDDKPLATPEQLAQIRNAGLRAAAAQDMVVVKK
jgi:hypothetical protein